jgi:hypothetical protein
VVIRTVPPRETSGDRVRDQETLKVEHVRIVEEAVSKCHWLWPFNSPVDQARNEVASPTDLVLIRDV